MTYMKKSLQILFFFMLFLLTFLSSCKKNGPTYPDNLPPGSRDYIWTCDTLYSKDNPFVYIGRLWGSDSANVWAAGLGGQEGVWHFDGNKWSINRSENMLTVLAMFGFSRSNLWAGSAFGSIYRCTDSKTWQKVSYNIPQKFVHICYNDMWGPSSNEIYAVGYAADSMESNFRIFASRYDGNSWSVMNLPDIPGQLVYIRKQSKSGILLMVVMDSEPNQPRIQRIYSYDGKEFKNMQAEGRMVALSNMEGEVYITIDKRIYKYWNGNIVLWKDFRNTIYFDRIWGRNEKDFFFDTYNNGRYGIGHYNGENMVELFHPEPNYAVFDGVILRNDIFFLGRDNNTNKSIIIHGKRRNSE